MSGGWGKRVSVAAVVLAALAGCDSQPTVTQVYATSASQQQAAGDPAAAGVQVNSVDFPFAVDITCG